MSATPGAPEFDSAFAKKARGVTRRRLASLALSGSLLGLGVGLLGALALWRLGFGAERLACAGLGGLGAAAGALLGLRTRWSDSELALYLDARLKSAETLTTALCARNGTEASEPALAHVLEQGSAVLRAHERTAVGPRVVQRVHWLVPICALAIVAVSRMPVRAPPAKAQGPGIDSVKQQNLAGLERIEALAKLPSRTPEQAERLRAIAEQAKKLREALALGLERREALSELGKMRDEISAERLKLADPQNRAGLDAAQNAFGKKRVLEGAQRALGNGDLTQFDEEMKRLANRAEEADREVAKDALEQAERAARDKGAQGLADALRDQKKLFEERESKAEALRELAEAMRDKLSPEALSDLKDFGASGDPEAQRKLAEAMEKALEGLSPEERQQLAERLSKQLEQSGGGGGKAMSKRELEALAKKLAGKGGADALRDELRDMAKQESSDDSRREQGLGDAERGDSEAQRGLGAVPMPMPGESNGAPGSSPPSKGGEAKDGKGGPSSSGPGSHHDTGTGDHAGSTPEIHGKELRAKAQAALQGSGPMHGATLGRAPARAGETANQLGAGALGSVGQAEVGAVDHADIPEEYREQVGRYFEP